VKSYKGYFILGLVLGVAIGVALIMYNEAPTPQEVGVPIVCMQDAPIIYDWQGELITNYWNDGVRNE
jgi:hypothetical protein